MSDGMVRREFLGLSLAGGAAWLMSGGAQAAAAVPQSGELTVGAATISITLDKPVALMGQMHLRVSKSVEAPVTANALALEARQDGKVVDQVIFVSCDLVVFRSAIVGRIRQRAKDRLPDFDPSKLIVNATHTHSAPGMVNPSYDIPKDVMQPAEYADFLVDRLVEVIAKAWSSRKPGMAGWGLGHAVVGQNRRAVYSDGHSQMYGKTNQPDFRGFEGYEDHDVDVLCFWNAEEKLIATAVNVVCPAQETEHCLTINADYWHEVRKLLHARHGDDLVVLGWIGAAGDQSPHLMYRKAAEERMRNLRGLTRVEELARRIDRGWQEAYEGACKEKRSQTPLAHVVSPLLLPPRKITAEELAAAKAKVEEYSKSPNGQGWMNWHKRVITRYEQQEAGHVESYPMELHVVRIGDVAITTNAFELFTDYGIQIKARSPAIQTFVIQLAGDGTYLPTERAVRGGGYSAVPQSNAVGPEGGQVLVEKTVEATQALWAK